MFGDNWIWYSILGAILLGVAMSIYKLPSFTKKFETAEPHKVIDATALTLWSSIFMFMLSTLLFLPLILKRIHIGGHIDNQVIIIASVRGLFFVLISYLQIKALSYAATNALFSLSSLASLSIVILSGVIFFQESLNITQVIGLLLVLFVIGGFAWSNKGKKHIIITKVSVSMWLGIVTLSASGNLLNKIATMHKNIYTHQLILYFVIFLSSAFIFYKTHIDTNMKKVKLLHRRTALAGLINGVFGFFGGWSLYTALAHGPISITQTINSCYILVTAVIAAIWMGERQKLNKGILILICLTIIALLLLRSK